MDRNSQVIRILKVIHYLEINPRGMTVKSIYERLLADGFQVTERTVRRDLMAISGAHLPLQCVNEESKQPEKIWKLKSMASINGKIQFTCQELLALFLARESLRVFNHSSLFTPINAFFERLEKALGIK
jgi:predicted DNA-binding transcriptional regulator YafY